MIEKKPLRADAERNRRRVLEVAQAVFATEGLAVPIDEIARRAGLGVGTLYRHFPTKEALFAAIVVGRVEDLVAQGTEALDAPDAAEAFFGFLGRMVGDGASKKDFMDALANTGIDLSKVFGPIKKELARVLGLLLERAQAAGAVREDVGVPEVMALMTGAFGSLERYGAGTRGRDRLLAIVLDGLRPPQVEKKRAVGGARPTPTGRTGRTGTARNRMVGREPSA
jgi:AcrR family transcriptional regulator